MRLNARVLAVSGVVLALGVCLFSAVGLGTAADDKEKKEVTDAVLKMADAFEKGDNAALKKQTEDLCKDPPAGKGTPLGTVMELLKLRSKDGLGIGATPGAITPDGIEAKIQEMAKKAPSAAVLGKQGADLEKIANITGAISQVAEFYTPKKKVGDKDPKDWKNWTEDMRAGSADLAKAIKAKNEKDIKTAANKLNSSCNNCHGVFRD
jgi:Cytochrome C'